MNAAAHVKVVVIFASFLVGHRGRDRRNRPMRAQADTHIARTTDRRWRTSLLYPGKSRDRHDAGPVPEGSHE
jgi:hypothetical protein